MERFLLNEKSHKIIFTNIALYLKTFHDYSQHYYNDIRIRHSVRLNINSNEKNAKSSNQKYIKAFITSNRKTRIC